jgi:hypothetical protein
VSEDGAVKRPFSAVIDSFSKEQPDMYPSANKAQQITSMVNRPQGLRSQERFTTLL